MSIVINTNVDSIKIQNCLTSATNKLSQSIERMSTGLKVNSAKDDASGCVISARMQVRLDGNQTAQNNVQNANSMLATLEGNIDVVEENISRIRDLTLQAKNGTYSVEEIQAMDDEVQERIAEINRISYSSTFSSLNLFTDEVLQEKGATFQVGPDAGYDNTIAASKDLFQSVEFSALSGMGNFSLISIYKGNITGNDNAGDNPIEYGKNDVVYNDDTNAANAANPSWDVKNGDVYTNESDWDTAIRAMDQAIDDITARKSIIGSAENRMESALQNLTTQYENLSSANSVIVDDDVAAEASAYTRASILQQVSTSLLAQANQAPAIALSLV